MKLLMIGDVVSQPGCETVRSCLPALKRRFGANVAFSSSRKIRSAVVNGFSSGSIKDVPCKFITSREKAPPS